MSASEPNLDTQQQGGQDEPQNEGSRKKKVKWTHISIFCFLLSQTGSPDHRAERPTHVHDDAEG